MPWLLDKAGEIITNYLHRWYGLLAAEFLLLVSSLLIFQLIPSGRLRFRYYGIGVGVIGIIILIAWLSYAFRYPRRSRKRLGVAIAIHIEDKESMEFFKKDFLAPLRSKIADLKLPFDVLVLRNHQSEKIETIEDVQKVLKKTKAHFCLWGSVKKRMNVPEGERFIFSLRGNVIHAPIKGVQSILLRDEFNLLLPYTMVFEEKLQFEGFNFRANQVLIALDYITGRAALLSGDPDIAINLHEPLLEIIQRGEHFPIGRDALKKIISLEYDLKALFEHSRNPESSVYKESIKKSLQYDPNNYGALLKKATAEFDNGRGDARIALNTIQQAGKYSGGEPQWLFNQAFLLFWLEEYTKAAVLCERLKRKQHVNDRATAQEVVAYNENLLKNFNKPQLYYWLGFVSCVKNDNVSMADKYFQMFLTLATDKMKDLKDRASDYLLTIQKEIGYTS